MHEVEDSCKRPVMVVSQALQQHIILRHVLRLCLDFGRSDVRISKLPNLSPSRPQIST